jgi:AraC-like DNA-binding protein
MSDQGNEIEARYSPSAPVRPSDDEIDEALASANALHKAAWSQRPFRERLAILARLADLMEEKADDLALVLAQTAGKSVSEARWEIGIAAEIARSYAREESLLVSPAPSLGGYLRDKVRLRPPSPRPGTLDARRLQRTFRFIDANLAAQITTEDLASTAALSRFHFSRLFKATTGQTPRQFIAGRRLERAKAHLVEGRSTAETAQECGFSSESNFGRFFRRATGHTPGSYRNLVRKPPTPAAFGGGETRTQHDRNEG